MVDKAHFTYLTFSPALDRHIFPRGIFSRLHFPGGGKFSPFISLIIKHFFPTLSWQPYLFSNMAPELGREIFNN
jgi:hypothetical protein